MREAINALDLNDTNESRVLRDLSGFSNSFRIIAKQKSIQKEGNLFVIDSDFDVLYTIIPSPEYKEALEQHLRKHGHLPPSYESMVAAYEAARVMIHDHMVKMPLCRHYFSMLSVINFFSGYFSTLKKHRKVPILPQCVMSHVKGSPSLFPHLPVKVIRKEPLKLNVHQALRKVIESHAVQLNSSFLRLFDQILRSASQSVEAIELEDKKTIASFFQAGLKENLLDQCSAPLQRHLSSSEKLLGEIENDLQIQSVKLVDDILTMFKAHVEAIRSREELSRINGIDLINNQQLKNKAIKGFFELVCKLQPDDNINLYEMTYNSMRIVSEINAKEVERGKKIVGGCGMELNIQKIQTSTKAATILQNNWAKISTLFPETWANVKNDNSGPSDEAIFRLQFEDLPAWIDDDYQWMESYLLTPPERATKQIEDRLKIDEAMSRGDKREFMSLVDQATDIATMKDRYQRTFMHRAATLKDSSYLEILLEKGLSYLCEDIHGYLPIHYAAMSGSLESLHCLLQMDKNRQTLDALSKNKSTPLIVAIQHQQLEIMRVLLKNQAKLTSLVESYNPLHCALHQGHFKLIDELLDFIPSSSTCINESAEDEGTPLMLACELDSLELVQKLVEKGAQPSSKRKDGITAIEIAMKRKCRPIVEYLLKYVESNVEYRLKYVESNPVVEIAAQECSIEIIELLNRKLDIYLFQNAHLDTALHIAIRNGNIPVAIFIVQNCKKEGFLDLKNLEKHTALDLAASAGLWDLAEILFDQGAKITDFRRLLRAGYHPLLKKISGQIELSENALQEHLLFAVQSGNYRVISEILIPRGAKIDQLKGPNGWQILHYLAKLDGLALFRKLIKPVDLLHPLQEEEGKTLPYIAAENGSQRILRLLLEQMKKKNSSLQNHFQERHLLYALIEAGNFENIQMMFEIFKDHPLINEILDVQLTRPLHLAAKIGSKKIVKFLIERGANLIHADKNGYTPLDYAVRAKAKKLTSFLLETNQQITIHVKALYEAASQKEEALLDLLMQSNKPKKLNGALLKAVVEHDLLAFSRLLKHGASLNCITPSGWTALLFASDTGQHEIVSIILRMNVLDRRSVKDGNALHLACKKGHTECVRLLLKAGFENEENQKGKTGLDLADGHQGILALFENKEKVYQKNLEAFLKAIETDSVEDVKRWLQDLPLNQSLSVTYNFIEIWGTPLQILLRIGKHKKVISCVYEVLGRDELLPNIQDSKGDTLAHLLVAAGMPLPSNLQVNNGIKNHEGKTALHIAAQEGNPKIIESLLDRPSADINGVSKNGRTALFYAIERKKEDNVHLLLKKGANIQHRDNTLMTPLLFACQLEALSIVKILLQNGADPNQTGTIEKVVPLHFSLVQERDEMARTLLFHGANCDIVSADGTQVIHLAAEMGKLQFLRLLSAKGYSLNIKDKKGRQAIHYAAENGKTEIVSTIISAQEDSIDISMDLVEKKNNKKQGRASRSGITPLHLAIKRGQSHTIQYLLEKHADIEAKTASGMDALSFASAFAPKSTLEFLFKYNLSRNSKSLLSALVTAISHDNVESMRAVYDRGVTVNADLMDGCTGLHLASLSGALNCTQWLLKNGADYQHPCSLPEKAGENALEISAANDSSEQFNLLLEFIQPDLEQINARGEALIHIATRAGNLKHLMLLIMNGAFLSEGNSFGYTPLHIAAKEGHTSIVKLLLACGADSSVKSFDDKSPADMVKIHDKSTQAAFQEFQLALKLSKKDESALHLAVRSGNALAVLLLSHEEDVDQQSSDGTSPLHLAVNSAQIEMIKHLLRAKATVDLPDCEGKTPLYDACMRHNLFIVEALISAGADPLVKDKNGESILQRIETLDFPEKVELTRILISSIKK